MCDRGQDSWFHPGVQRLVAQNADWTQRESQPFQDKQTKQNKITKQKNLVGVGLEEE